MAHKQNKTPSAHLDLLFASTGKNLRENGRNKYKVDWVRCENVLSRHAVKFPAAYCDLWGRIPDKNRIRTYRKTTFWLLCPSAHRAAANLKPRNNDISDIWCFSSVITATCLCHSLTHTQKTLTLFTSLSFYTQLLNISSGSDNK